jgi:formylglycine-generating enzyme required for sulfatase activity
VTFPEDYAAPRHLARYSNHPADMVNWWDAVAFCHWLSKEDLVFRLPTEFEWQLAATGGDSAYIYPWGAAWDPRDEPWRANTFESGLGCTTAVGMYPAGASLEGVLDLAGTVWEWCSNSFDDPGRAVPAASRDLRAVRGGSWINSQGFARSTVRGRYLPSHRGGGVGFRVVCSSASTVSD